MKLYHILRININFVANLLGGTSYSEACYIRHEYLDGLKDSLS